MKRRRDRNVTEMAQDGVSIGGDVRAEHGVAAGRDVIADLIVTGGRNTFFVGGYQRLADAYIDASEVFDRVDVDRFVGRQWLAAALDRFLTEQDNGYFIVEAAAGLGKTSFLAHLVKQRRWVHHFCELTPGDAGIAPARLNLAAQLVRAYELRTNSGVEVLSEAAAARPDFLRGLMSEAASQLEAGEKVAIAVDGLDEAVTRPGENVLGLPRTLPSGVYVVASRRPVPLSFFADGPRSVVQIDADSIDNREDIRAFLTQAAAQPAIAGALRRRDMATDDFISRLVARSGGVWVYVHYAVDHLLTHADSELDLDALPDGLWHWYYRFWQAWKTSHPSDWHTMYLPVLATIAVAEEDLTLDQLGRFVGVDAIAELPPEWRPYLTVRRAQPRRYRIQHASLNDFLTGDAEVDGVAEQDFADELQEAARAAHVRIAMQYVTGDLDDWSDDDGYASRHLAAHLHHACCFNELFALVDNAVWHSAQLRQDPSGARLLSDLGHAWDLAAEDDAAAITLHREPPYLVRELRCALSSAELRSRYDLPGEVLARLVALEMWSPAHALAAASRIATDANRARALRLLAPHLTPELLDEASAAAADLDEPQERAEAVAGIAPCLTDDARTSVVAATLSAAAHTGSAGDTASLLAPWLTPELIDLALDAARTARNIPEALASLAPLLSPERHDAALELAMEQAEPSVRAAALADLLPHLGDQQRQQALQDGLAAAAAIEQPEDRTIAFAALAQSLSDRPREDALKHALDAAAEIYTGHPAALASGLGRVAPLLSRDALSRALEIALAPSNVDTRASAVAALAPYLPGHERRNVLAMVLTGLTTTYAEYLGERTGALIALLPHLAGKESGVAIETLLSIAERTKHSTWGTAGYVITQLAPFLPTRRLPRAAALAAELDDRPARVEALTAMAMRIRKAADRERWLDAATDATLEITDGVDRQRALAALGPHLPRRLAERLLSATGAQHDAHVSAWAALMPALGPEHRAAAMAKALDAAGHIGDAVARVTALAPLAPHLPAPERDEALRVAAAIPSAELRAETLASYARFLDDELLGTAVDALGELAHGRADILISLAPHLRGKRALAAGMTLDRIDDQGSQAAAFAALAPQLPDEILSDAARAAIDMNVGYEAQLELFGVGFDTLEAMSPRLSERQLAEALQVAVAETDEYTKAGALQTLAAHLHGELATAALAASRAIEDGWQRFRTIVTLIPNLDGDERTSTIQDARSLLDDVDPDLRGYGVAAIAPFVPESEHTVALTEAVAQARRKADRDSAAARVLLVELAPFLSGEALLDACSASAAVRGPADRAEAVAAIAPRLGDELRTSVVIDALRYVYEDSRPHAKPVARLAPHIPSPGIVDALAGTASIERPVDRAETVGVLGAELIERRRRRESRHATSIDEMTDGPVARDSAFAAWRGAVRAAVPDGSHAVAAAVSGAAPMLDFLCGTEITASTDRSSGQ